MVRRTTIEIDEDLLLRAKRALGSRTTRATVEQALREAADRHEDRHAQHAERQRRYLAGLASVSDLDVLGGDEMWR